MTTAPCIIGFAGVPEHTRDLVVGTTKRIFFDVRSVGGGGGVAEWADPEVLTVKVLNGEGEETTALVYGKDAAVKRDDVGNYFLDLELDHPGRWVFRAEASGDMIGASEASFFVPDSAFDEA